MAEDEANKGLVQLIKTGFYRNVHKKQAKIAQERARVVLSLAILLQASTLFYYSFMLYTLLTIMCR